MQKFSFLSNVIYYQNTQTVEVHCKQPFDGDVSIQINSSYSDLDQAKYQILKGQTLIFTYKPRVNGFIKVVRVWGAYLDYDNFLDVDFKIVSNQTYINQQLNDPTPVSVGSSDKISQTYYDFQGWTNVEIFKKISVDTENVNFLLSEHSGAQYVITSNDPDFVVTNPNIYFSESGQSFVEITQADIDSIGICMQIVFGGNEYELQGANDVSTLEQELYLTFSNDSKIQVYKQNEKILIYSNYEDRNKLIFKSINKSFSKVFSKTQNNKNSIEVKILKHDWQYRKVEFDIVAFGNVKRPKMIVHFEIPQLSEYHFELSDDLQIGQSYKLLMKSNKRIYDKLLMVSNNVTCENILSSQEDFQTVSWYVKPISNGVATFSVKNTCTASYNIYDKPEPLSLLSTLNVEKDEVQLTVLLNDSVSYDYDYEISFNDKLSKQNVDYRLITSYHTIPAGQLSKIEKIAWTTGQTLRSFDILLDGKTIPVTWFDKTYYPNIIGLRDNYSKHFINRSISRPLTVSYTDDSTSDVFTIAAGQTDWTYVPNSDQVVWQVYDQSCLIFSQTITYIKPDEQKPRISLSIDDTLNVKSSNYLTVKLDWPVNYDVIFELSCTGNTDLKLSGSYKIKANQTSIKFKVTPLVLRNNPAFLSLQLLSSNVDFDNKKISVILS